MPILSAWLSEYERYLAAARKAPGVPDYEAAWDEGSALALEEAVGVAGKDSST